MTDSNRIAGFPPLASPGARVLILGSMPSVASLQKQQYYGQAQNAFWRIMGELFNCGPELPYNERSAGLTAAGVAVWDVLATCVRPGSLDSAIDMRTIEVNDFAGMLHEYPDIQHIYFNGRKAEQIFYRRVAGSLTTLRPALRYTSLPSTSPAMASLSFAAKLKRWRALTV